MWRKGLITAKVAKHAKFREGFSLKFLCAFCALFGNPLGALAVEIALRHRNYTAVLIQSTV
uniref:Uncharacterized protein n=1 Tax=uncultured bacterium A1Q1_fos_485 TaxID=1256576 RepID=L7VUD2_9BACT|nr:hypothetical protein [uncultured bacterium A1Q1_fos_485]